MGKGPIFIEDLSIFHLYVQSLKEVTLFSGDHFVMYQDIKSLCHAPETKFVSQLHFNKNIYTHRCMHVSLLIPGFR